MYVSFLAKYSLATGYSVDDLVEMEIQLSSKIPEFEVFKREQISLNRKRRSTRIYGTEQRYLIETAPIVGKQKNEEMIMFLNSVQSGDTFSADINNNVNLSMSNFVLLDRADEPQRINKITYFYSFKILAV